MQQLKKLSKKPLVSILTTCFNSKKYIEDCIKSVLNQDYLYIEHIIQDGNSNDGTKRILGKYKRKKYKNRIKIFSEEDNGQVEGLGTALQKCSGEIILVLNSDDKLMPYAVSWAVENLKKYPSVGAIYGDAYIIDEKNEITSIKQSKDYDFEKLICVELVPPAQATFIRRDAWEKVGFYIDRMLDTCPDYEVWVRVALKFPIKHIFGVVTRYRHYQTPQLDSKVTRTAWRFVRAKKGVMDRLFDNPKTKPEIRKLRQRAHSSLYLWGSKTSVNLGDAKGGLVFFIQSFLIKPTFGKFWKLIKTIKTLIWMSIFTA